VWHSWLDEGVSRVRFEQASRNNKKAAYTGAYGYLPNYHVSNCPHLTEALFGPGMAHSSAQCTCIFFF